MPSGADLTPDELRRLQAVLVTRGVMADADTLTAQLVSGGRSNLTYEIAGAERSWILRRPPLGHVLSSAHDMSREFRVLEALAGDRSAVPVPEPIVESSDASVIGAPFYVMEKVPGDVLRRVDDALRLSDVEQVAVSERLIDILCELHVVDPEAVGLGQFGRPHGFMRRQASRWTAQLAASRSRDIVGIQELGEGLARSVPEQVDATIVHGDYRLDNCLVAGGDITAVLDWEMSTLGDPLSDLGLLAVYHEGLADIPNPVVESPGGSGAYPALDVLLERYATGSGRDLSRLGWYIAFAWFKLAVILESIHYRGTLGATAGEGFDGVSGLVQPVVDRGREAFARCSV